MKSVEALSEIADKARATVFDDGGRRSSHLEKWLRQAQQLWRVSFRGLICGV
ncbi:MAG: hypothetical protein ACTHW3_07500 [Leucobacter sp.]